VTGRRARERLPRPTSFRAVLQEETPDSVGRFPILRPTQPAATFAIPELDGSSTRGVRALFGVPTDPPACSTLSQSRRLGYA